MANWASGNFLFPTSSGNHAITGCPFEPQGVFFIGTNQASEDALIATADPNLFFGMTWIDYLTGLPDSQSVCLSMDAGINVKPYPIVMAASTGCAEDYRALFSSFNGDGFTINVTNPANDDRPITWLAYGGYEFAAGSANLTLTNAIYSLGYKILTAFAMNYRTSTLIRDGCEDGQYTSLYLGCASYPTTDSPPTYGSRSWGSGGTSRFNVTGAQGFTKTVANITPNPQFQSAINISTGDFPPIVLEDRISLWRAIPETDIQASVGGGPLRWMAQWWSGESWNNSFIAASSVGDTNTFTSGNPFLTKIEAAICVSVLGQPAQGLAADSRMGIGFIGPEDIQGCVAANQTGHVFQSTQYGYVDWCNASGVHVAEGTIVQDHIDWETTLASSGTGSLSVIFCFGPGGVFWLPQMYRRWPY